MKNNLNLEDLSKLGINENRITHCFAQKGLNIKYEDLNWIRKSIVDNSSTDIISTANEFTDQDLKIRHSFVSFEDDTIPVKQLNEENCIVAALESVASHVQTLDPSDLLAAQKLLLEFIDLILAHKEVREARKLRTIFSKWLPVIRETAPNTHFYAELQLSFFLFKFDSCKKSFIDFQKIKSLILSNKSVIDQIGKDNNFYVSREKLLQTLEILEHELVNFVKSNSTYHERFSLHDFSNSNFVRELHFSEVIKISGVFFGNSHALFTSVFEEKTLVFGVGDNSYGQIVPQSDVKFFVRPLLLDYLEEYGVNKIGAKSDVSFVSGSSSIIVWGKTVQNSYKVLSRNTTSEIFTIGLISDNVVYSTANNQFFKLSLKNETKEIPIGQIEGKIKEISTGSSHMLILTEDGLIYAYGSNHFHQICDSKTKKVFEEISKIESVSSEKIVSIACIGDLTIMVDQALICHVFGTVNSKKEIRYPESFELSENNSLKELGNEESIKISGNEKKIILFLKQTVYEWTTDYGFKLKPRPKTEPDTLKNVHLAKTFEFTEKRCVFGSNCEFFVENEKIKKAESVKCRFIFKDADGDEFKSEVCKDILTLNLLKNTQLKNNYNCDKGNFNTVVYKNEKVEVLSTHMADICFGAMSFKRSEEVHFDFKCNQVGLYVFQIFCNGRKVKNEYILEVLNSKDEARDEQPESQPEFNTFLTSSSFRTNMKTEGDAKLHESLLNLSKQQLPDKPNLKIKLKPIEEAPQSIFVHKNKKILIRYSSIKSKKHHPDEGRSFVENKFTVKGTTRLPPMQDLISAFSQIKTDKFVFKKGEKKN